MPLLLLILVAAAAGVFVFALAWRYPKVPASPLPTLTAASSVGRAAKRHSRFRKLLDARLSPSKATGLALTLALVLVIGGGVLLGMLAYLIRSSPHLARIDNSVAAWGDEHASSFSTHGLKLVTTLGTTWFVISFAVVLAAVEWSRTRSNWIVPYLVVVIAGNAALTLAVKDLVDRVRPTLNPVAATLGPSFPSGHSSTAAALYAAAALLLGRRRGHTARALLAGGAVAIAVAVACSRVLLDVHWLSDVIAGLTLGWAWFAVCSIAFGGRLLRWGATAETVVRAADADEHRDKERSASATAA